MLITEISRIVFFGLLVELIILATAIFFGNDKKKMFSVILVCTFFVGAVGFSKEIGRLLSYDYENVPTQIIPTNTSNTIGLDSIQYEIEKLVSEWDVIHREADLTLDTSRLSSVLYGNALQEQLKTISELQRDNCYWTIVEIEPFRIEKMEVLSPNMVKVEVYKNWDMDKYCDSVKVGNEDGYFIALYDVERIQNEWLITSKGYKH